ncbi:hypothetical protein ACIQGZ_14795 [Streptomyces sp. NPDC092296]|uniref:hypothetical protein n=1 Tax=Streptomyces sp. NPDC092296 TaxID=3366012 RepID=UPI0038017B06
MSGEHDFPALGFDPAPGDIGNVDALVTQLNTAAGALDSAHRTLTSLGRSGSAWEGAAAEAFAGKVGELPKNLDDSVQALKTAGTQLDSWSRQLASYQQTAKQYEQRAADAKQRLDAARSRADQATAGYNQAAGNPDFRLGGRYFADAQQLAAADARLKAAQQQLQAAGDQLETAQRDLDAIQDELDGIVKQAKELLEHHQDDADRTAGALRKANQNAPSTSFWDKLGDGFKKLGHKIQDWATKHADILKKIGDIAGAASAVLGIAALATMWCPPLSAALGAGAAGASLVAVGAHGLAKLGGADVSWTTLALDGVGAIPFVGTATKAGKGVVMGVKTAVKARSVVEGGAELANAGRSITETAKAGTFMHKFAITPLMTKTPLRNLPGVTKVIEGGEEAWHLDPLSWWSRGTQIGIKGGGLAHNAPKLYNEFAGEPA